jgi:phosphopantetheine adenylyltransferase/dephospho-CoA kinase
MQNYSAAVIAIICELWQIERFLAGELGVKILCLTGGLASGKSTATEFLEQQGALVIDADKLGHRAYDPGTQAYLQIIEAFGDDVVDDEHRIDRKVLGGKVFGQPAALKQLTDIVWPEIRRLAELEIAGLDAAYPDGLVVLEAAVLFEAGWDDIGDEVWAVVAERETAIDRAMARDGFAREAVEQRLDAQLSNDERGRRADVVIDNSGMLSNMQAQLAEQWMRLSGIK